MKHLLRSIVFIGILVHALGSHAQSVTVSSGSPYNQYVTALEGPGVDISNVTINCDTVGNPFLTQLPQMGSFNATSTVPPLGVTLGLLMTTGSITNALPSGGTGTSLGTPGTPTLNTLAGGVTSDACLVTFNLVASCDTVRIRYVFASNEYPTFVGNFNDIFACFITGPGFTPNTNIALVPNTTIPVSINSINSGTNSQFHVVNSSGTGYNEHSVVLEAVAPVVPCQTYTITFAIADEQDAAFDSGVFIEPITCGSEPPSVIARNFNNPNSNEAVEGCVDGFFTFFNPNPAQALNVTFTLLGTATPGLDFTSPIAGGVVIPPGVDSINIPINVINDGIAEGDESIIVALNVLSCFSDTAVLIIKDPFRANAGPDKDVCSGVAATIGAPAQPNVTYAWNAAPGLQAPLNIAQPTVQFVANIPFTFDYVLSANDQNGCFDTDTVAVSFKPLPAADFAVPQQVCINDIATISFLPPPTPGAAYFWNFGPGTSSIIGASQGPYQVTWNTPGPKQIKLVVSDGACTSDTVRKTVTVNPIPTSGFSVTPQVCAGQAAQAIYTGTADPNTATFTWDFGGGQGAGGGTPFGIVWTTPGIKTVTLTVTENGCISSTSVQTVTVFPVPTASFAVQPQICEDDVMQITYTGSAAASATYIWSFGPGAQVLGGSGQGPYQVRWATGGIRDV
ncbi:MAG: choice-of-anchor L domain-containing protein, partial [Bacteroidia bacterium]|nr:choice-of-anchor L domain-containing protein [Bacteroidia bacterium]